MLVTMTLLAVAIGAAAPADAAPAAQIEAAAAPAEAAPAPIETPAVAETPVVADTPAPDAAAIEAAPAGEAPRGDTTIQALSDPFEPANRVVYRFNDVVDRAALEPIARGYRAATPRVVRRGVSNFLDNLGAPSSFANAVLQGNLKRAGTTAGRFGINTTFGLLGILDPASDVGLKSYDEDFGQTLGVWGVPPGPYIYLPLLGPSTVRDTAGAVVNIALSPFTYMNGADVDEFRAIRGGVGAVAGREAALDPVDSLRRSSPDPYVSIRSLYGQARASAIANGEQDVSALPDFGDIPEAGGVQ